MQLSDLSNHINFWASPLTLSEKKTTVLTSEVLMSDGPHRSLPLKRHWKRVAEKAEKPSYSIAEVAETISNALLQEMKEVDPLMSKISKIFIGDGQLSIFRVDLRDQFEAIQCTFRGSAASDILIGCAIEADANGLTGHAALNTTVANFLEAHSHGNCRSIEEHYLRKQPWNTVNIRDRLKAARTQLPYAEIASEMMRSKTGNNSRFRLVKRTGVDEGPQL